MTAADSLELAERLSGGVLAAARANRSPEAPGTDERVLDRLVTTCRAPDAVDLLGLPDRAASLPAFLRETRSAPPTPAEIAGVIDRLTGLLARDRPLLLAVLFSPGSLLKRLPEIAGEDGWSELCWVLLCWLSEAAWDCVSAPTREADRRHFLPLAARLRFLVLSEPMRHRADMNSPWLEHYAPELANHYDVYAAAFGEDTWFDLLGRCREARWNWQAQLDAHQSAPLLAQAGASEIERELGLLAFRTGRAGRPLVLSPKPLDEPDGVGADDRAVIAEITDRHLLPRFQLGRVLALASAAPLRWSLALTVLPLAPAAAAVTLAILGRFTAAAQTALGCYALIGLVTVVGGARMSAPWLLRVPAASGVGLVVLLALHPTWWNVPKGGWGTPLALLALSFGYLVIEVRNHGVAAGRAIARASVVTVIGALHAFLVSLIGLVVIAPAYAERPDNGPRIADWFASAPHSTSWQLLTLAAALCLAVGVFSQILWEDRPITASLAHTNWRSGS
ncbi:hypothetical protein [Actinomadura algeriensis]|uniref:Uncharacterized protein n=1 Tax=Actinomadura algeriensis TaxID=1679523 RepID=A0ABR9JU74_9ACTN|nr:hypothetical protein [Actinomadura algeriensis]MBE1533954.1 hypothetical protein [Actinomadura algeriensis]